MNTKDQQVFTMNVTDLRKKLRRSVMNQATGSLPSDRRKTNDRRLQKSEFNSGNSQRIWLTPGERNLIEDLYLLQDE